jgi:hypothetical protein
VASTYVVVKDAKKAAEYFNAGVLYYLWNIRGSERVWKPQTIFGKCPGPMQEELQVGYWAILVEEDEE